MTTVIDLPSGEICGSLMRTILPMSPIENFAADKAIADAKRRVASLLRMASLYSSAISPAGVLP